MVNDIFQDHNAFYCKKTVKLL